LSVPRVRCFRAIIILFRFDSAPIKVRESQNVPGSWIVFSGAEAVEAAKREGRVEIACVAV
jgi:hypothetical protein